MPVIRSSRRSSSPRTVSLRRLASTTAALNTSISASSATPSHGWPECQAAAR